MGGDEAAEPVPFGLDLLVVVEHPGHVPGRCGEPGGQVQGHRDTTLHVHAVASPQHLVPLDVAQLAGQVARHRHGVDVPGDDRPPRAALPGARHDGVAVAQHLEVGQRLQGRRDGVGRQFARQYLAAYKVPRTVLFMTEEELPMTGSAKVRRTELKAMASRRLAGLSR